MADDSPQTHFETMLTGRGFSMEDATAIGQSCITNRHVLDMMSAHALQRLLPAREASMATDAQGRKRPTPQTEAIEQRSFDLGSAWTRGFGVDYERMVREGHGHAPEPSQPIPYASSSYERQGRVLSWNEFTQLSLPATEAAPAVSAAEAAKDMLREDYEMALDKVLEGKRDCNTVPIAAREAVKSVDLTGLPRLEHGDPSSPALPVMRRDGPQLG